MRSARSAPARRRLSRWSSFSLCALVGLLPALSGCGNLTAGGLGEVVVELQGGDAETDADSAFLADATPGFNAHPGGPPGGPGNGPPGEPPRGGPGGPAFQGEVTVTFEVFVRDAAGSWIDLTGGRRDAAVDSRGTEVLEVARAILPEVGLDRIRIVFHAAEVLVNSAPPGQGITPGERVEVDFGGAPTLVVERPLGARVTREGVGLRVNLRAGVWIRAAVMGRVPGQSFQSAVQVQVTRGADGD